MKESNLRHAVLETAVLPTGLMAHVLHAMLGSVKTQTLSFVRQRFYLWADGVWRCCSTSQRLTCSIIPKQGCFAGCKITKSKRVFSAWCTENDGCQIRTNQNVVGVTRFRVLSLFFSAENQKRVTFRFNIFLHLVCYMECLRRFFEIIKGT